MLVDVLSLVEMNESSSNAQPAVPKGPAPDPNQQYVSGARLLEILFPPECRPTLRWLRDQQAARRIPSVKVGHLVFFCPAQVRAALEKNK